MPELKTGPQAFSASVQLHLIISGKQPPYRDVVGVNTLSRSAWALPLVTSRRASQHNARVPGMETTSSQLHGSTPHETNVSFARPVKLAFGDGERLPRSTLR